MKTKWKQEYEHIHLQPNEMSSGILLCFVRVCIV